jgi:hypothetical protein
LIHRVKLGAVTNRRRSCEDALNDRPALRRLLALLAFVLALISGAAASVMAQEVMKTLPDSVEGWFPKDGVYATPGADFNERCSKFDGLVLGLKVDGLVLELSNGSVSIGENKCNILTHSRRRPNEIYLKMICKGKTDPEIMDLRKIDDRSIMIRGRHELMNSSGPVEYCGEEAQRAYREQRAAK